MSKYGTLKDNEGNKIYPNAYYKIGDIFITTNEENPANRFGGTWEKLPDETFLMTASSKYAVKSTGGENEHTLTIEEMPSHGHEIKDTSYNVNFGRVDGGGGPNFPINGAGAGNSYGLVTALETGGNKPHNNMPKFYAVYVWIRVA